MRMFKIGIALIAFMFSVETVSAKVTWLPEYAESLEGQDNVKTPTSCADIGYKTAEDIGNMTCSKQQPVIGVGICYSGCYCDTDKYPYTLQNCSGDFKLAGKVCYDGNTYYYSQCEDHTCDNREHNIVNEDWGCMQYYEDCPDKCEIPYVDNCHNRGDNASAYGCKTYWDDCPSKCKDGVSCTPTNCSGFNLIKLPENVKDSATCVIGCGDATVRYKIVECEEGYELVEGQCQLIPCVPNDCSGFDLTEVPANAKDYETCEIGCGDTTVRYKVVECEEGYELVEGQCQPIPCVPNVCSGFDLTEVPANAKDYETCVIGCGDTTARYKVVECEEDYELVEGQCQPIPCVPNDCSGFDLTEVPANAKDYETCEIGCGDTTVRYKVKQCNFGYTLKDGKCEDLGAVVLIVTTTAADAKFSFDINGKSFEVDWGDGTIDSSETHTYTKAGTYKIGITGFPTHIEVGSLGTKFSNITIEDLDIESLTSGNNMFSKVSNIVSGEIPNLPPNLQEASEMFKGCDNLKGDFPELPEFLSNAQEMFYGCTGLGPDVPDLPDGLGSANSMFQDCTGIEGSLPPLPDSIKDAVAMFKGCTGLTGRISNIPALLMIGDQMFMECTGLEGEVPELPEELQSSTYMFYGCSGLSGRAPSKPRYLTSDMYTFTGTQVEYSSEWPRDAW